MKNVRPLHIEAMELADKAFSLQKKGDAKQAKQYFHEAYDLESKAALLIPIDENNEPTRSVLFRSAGALALNAGLYREAEKMVSQGLLGFPPNEIAAELRELFEQIAVNFVESY